MFDGAAKFKQNLNDWDVGKVTGTNNMFLNAAVFNAPLNAWNVAKLTSAKAMFKGATPMSDCNKKAIHNKFEAAPRSLNFDFDVATNTVLADRSDWKFPGLAC